MRANRTLIVTTWLSLLGMGVCAYLVYLHIGLMRGELLGGIVCGSGVFDCHAVTAGAWGSFLGMPLALWGLLGYVTVFSLSLLGLQSTEWTNDVLPVLCVVTLGVVLLDAALFAIMAFVIRFFCILCLTTYCINLVLLLLVWRGLGRPAPQALQAIGSSLAKLLPSRQRPATSLFWGILLVGAFGTFGVHAATMFVSRGAPGTVRKQIGEFVTKQQRVRVDTAGDPSLGPANAKFEVVEFSDFFCPACQRASKMNHIMLASHRGDVRFVFKNYPLDSSCNPNVSRIVHPGACRMAAAAECAHLQGAFWPFHDLVFEHGHDYKVTRLNEDARQLGIDVAAFERCLTSGEGSEAVKRDIAEAGKASVSSTPTYVINGLPMAGQLQPSVFEEVLDVLRND